MDDDVKSNAHFTKLDIQIFNRDVMEDCAWKTAFGEKVPYEMRFVISAMTIAQHIFGAGLPKTELDAAVSIQAGVSRPIAQRYIAEAKRRKYLLVLPSATNANSDVYTFAPDVPAKMRQVNEYRKQIAIVYTAQLANPSQSDAGAQYLPESVYANYSDPELKGLVEKAIRLKADELRAKSKGCTTMLKPVIAGAIFVVGLAAGLGLGVDVSLADTADFVGRISR